MSQLAATVADTAAIAAYLDNKELAHDVTLGLAKNDIVDGAAVTSETGMLVKAGIIDLDVTSDVFSFALLSPFSPGETVGNIHINSGQQIIEARARQAAFSNARMLASHSLLIALLVMFLVNRFLTRPLTRIAGELHRISPGGEDRLVSPRWHTRDEIGGLVADTNRLLDSVEKTLRNERELREQVETLEKRFRLIFERASAGIFLMDREGTLLASNNAFNELIGPELAGRMRATGEPKLTDLFENREELDVSLERVSQGSVSSAVDLELCGMFRQRARWLHCLFSSVTDDDGTLIIEGLMNDITERASREKNMRFEAEHDSLTGLMNRRAGKKHLRRAMNRADRALDASFALLMLDLDRFKPINDEYGHEAGDQVLVEVTRRLRDSVRGEDLVIRWGGDEFMIGLLKGYGPLDPVPVVEKLISEIGREIVLENNQRVTVGASIGVALFPSHADELDQLVFLADQAMYEVKGSGRHGYRIHEPLGQKLLAVSGRWPSPST